MTEAEIIRRYKNADKKREQIQILADLNACKTDVIKKILNDNGVPTQGGGKKKSGTLVPHGTNIPGQKTVPSIPEKEYRPLTPEKVEKMIEIPEEQIDPQPKAKMPEVIRVTLQEDLDFIEQQLHELIEKKIAIKNFLENN